MFGALQKEAAQRWVAVIPNCDRFSETGMETTVLSARDVGRIVQRIGLDVLMDELIAGIAQALAEHDPSICVTPPRNGFHYKEERSLGLIEWMPAMRARQQVTVKMVGYHPHNPQRWNIPTILSTVSVFDVATGHLMGVADATFLTAMRTGAASAIASRALARADSRCLGLIGAGAQACTQLHALSRTFDIDHVLIHDVDASAMRSFASRVSCLNLDLRVEAADLGTLVQRSDILCTATSVNAGAGPVFADEDLRPWLHINAVGADFPGKVEIPLSVLRRAFVCPDFLDQALKEGECQQLSAADIHATLVDVARDPSAYEAHRESLSVFDSTGWALEDEIAATLMLRYAEEMGIGQRVALESISPDPKDPYGFLQLDGRIAAETLADAREPEALALAANC